MTSIAGRVIHISGLAFNYYEYGTTAAPPLLLLHALGQDASEWDAVATALADRFRIIALDQRGHGASARPPDYSFERMRDDAIGLMDALGLERFTLAGHSMGGTVAFLIAESWPERIERLIIEDTPPPWGSNIPAPPAEPPSLVPFDWRLMAPIINQLNHPDPAWWSLLPTITSPTLIMGGGPTSHVPQHKLAEAAGLIPTSRLVTIDGAGHNIHRDAFDAFMQHVHAFLTSR